MRRKWALLTRFERATLEYLIGHLLQPWTTLSTNQPPSLDSTLKASGQPCDSGSRCIFTRSAEGRGAVLVSRPRGQLPGLDGVESAHDAFLIANHDVGLEAALQDIDVSSGLGAKVGGQCRRHIRPLETMLDMRQCWTYAYPIGRTHQKVSTTLSARKTYTPTPASINVEAILGF